MKSDSVSKSQTRPKIEDEAIKLLSIAADHREASVVALSG